MRELNKIRILLIAAVSVAAAVPAGAQESTLQLHSPGQLPEAPSPAQTATPNRLTRSLAPGLSYLESLTTAKNWPMVKPGASSTLLPPDALRQRLTFSFAPPVSRAASSHSYSLEHYSQRVPGAGPLILFGNRQAKAHPQVTRVLKFLAPIR